MLAKWKIPRAIGRSSLYLFFLFLLLILLVNGQIIYQDLMFPEQPTLYLVNQTIHSWSDLLAIYLHPKMLESLNIPFFRPSGHFLLYQLMSPLLGWQNTRGLLVVNFVFLALTGVMLVKIYELLFPGYKTGGFIAFAICIMHPLFLISRSTIMHFEFASFLFLLLSLYCFMNFCRENLQKNTSVPYAQIRFSHYQWLLLTILNYFIAITFKETTLMLMPALLVYLYLQLVNRAGSYKKIATNREGFKLALLLVLVTSIAATYLSLAWIGSQRPVLSAMHWQDLFSVFNKYLKIIFSFPYNFIPGVQEYSKGSLWEISILPWADSIVMLSAMCLLPVSVYRLWKSRSSPQKASSKQAFVFLYCSAGIFLLLPVLWRHAMPWHAGLSLMFLSLLIGYAAESLLQHYANVTNAKIISYSGAMLIACSTLWVNQINFQAIARHPLAFDYALDRNAIKHPPLLAGLNDDSVIIVEDRFIPHTDYQRGNSVYPYILLGNLDAHRMFKAAATYEFPYVYGGNMFRWAYNNIKLKEQIYPFRVEEMAKIPDSEIIYNWLQHFNNIFCVGFDEDGWWHDKTAQFKQNLLREQQLRHLVVNQYHGLSATALTGKTMLSQQINVPDSMVCKQMCDTSVSCAGFTYRNVSKDQSQVTNCRFFSAIATTLDHCPQCTAYVKSTNLTG